MLLQWEMCQCCLHFPWQLMQGGACALKGHYRMMCNALPHLVLGYCVPLPVPNIAAILQGSTNLECSTNAGTNAPQAPAKSMHLQAATCRCWGPHHMDFLVRQYMLLPYRLCVQTALHDKQSLGNQNGRPNLALPRQLWSTLPPELLGN